MIDDKTVVMKNAVIGKFDSVAWNVSIGGNTHD